MSNKYLEKIAGVLGRLGTAADNGIATFIRKSKNTVDALDRGAYKAVEKRLSKSNYASPGSRAYFHPGEPIDPVRAHALGVAAGAGAVTAVGAAGYGAVKLKNKLQEKQAALTLNKPKPVAQPSHEKMVKVLNRSKFVKKATSIRQLNSELEDPNHLRTAGRGLVGGFAGGLGGGVVGSILGGAAGGLANLATNGRLPNAIHVGGALGQDIGLLGGTIHGARHGIKTSLKNQLKEQASYRKAIKE